MKIIITIFTALSLLSCKKETIEHVENDYKKGYKSYNFVISQNVSSDPVVQVFENELGILNWTRSGIGLYEAYSIGTFKKDKTWVSSDGINVEIGGEDSFRIKTYKNGNPSDNILLNNYIEIIKT